MHTILQAAIVAVSLAVPAPKPAPVLQVVPVNLGVAGPTLAHLPRVMSVNLGITQVLPSAPKPVAVVLSTQKVSAR